MIRTLPFALFLAAFVVQAHGAVVINEIVAGSPESPDVDCGQQSPDVSAGRYPDGTPYRRSFVAPTPGSKNVEP